MNFDTPIDRTGSGALKWDRLAHVEGKPDIIPLWVADMDFASPPQVTEALRKRCGHPVFGYTDANPSYFEALRNWYATRYGVTAETADFILGPGAVPSLGIAVRSLSAPGDGVVVLSPVYYPFYEMIRNNGRLVVDVPLHPDGSGRFVLDLAALERSILETRKQGIRVPLLLLCSPHNPGGTVWRRPELEALLALASRLDLTIVSDELHGDFVYEPSRFLSLADFQDHTGRVVVISAPNKTFNLAGLHLSHFLVRDKLLRGKIGQGLSAMGYGNPNVLSLTAAEAAYTHSGPWLDELKDYLADNINFTLSFVAGNVPGVEPYKPEGTYLVWADAAGLIRGRELKDDRELVALLETEGRVKFTPGSFFGEGGKGFIRINIASPRSQLDVGLKRLADWAASRA